MNVVEAVCIACKKPFQRKVTNRNANKAPICSRACTARYARSKKPAPCSQHTTASAGAATAKPKFTAPRGY